MYIKEKLFLANQKGIAHLLLLIFLVVSILFTVYLTGKQTKLLSWASGDPCAAFSNPIVCENSKPGNPREEWDVKVDQFGFLGDTNIEGFATDQSINQGETVHFKVKTDAKNYRYDIYRIGYYGGSGARKVTTIRPVTTLPQIQPER